MDNHSFFRDKISDVLLQRGYEVAYPQLKELPYSDPFGELVRVDIEGGNKCASISFYSQGWLSIDTAEKDTGGSINENTIKMVLYKPEQIQEREIALLSLLDFLI